MTTETKLLIIISLYIFTLVSMLFHVNNLQTKKMPARRRCSKHSRGLKKGQLALITRNCDICNK